MSQHAVLSPSGGDNWMLCAGAPAMQFGLPDAPSNYSDEGSAAHLVGSTCLETGNGPGAYVGKVILVGSTDTFDGAVWETDAGDDFYAGFVVRRRYVVDAEMAEQVAKYVNKVREYQGNGILMSEQRISISTYTGEEGAEGTSDAVVVRDGELIVMDLKYGMGHKVSAIRNRQMMIYALGVRETHEMAYGPFKSIRLVILQPRLDAVSEWDCTPAELDAFGEEVKAAAAKALAIWRSRSVEHAIDLKPSDDACRWCKAKATCPRLAKFVADSCAADFTAVVPEIGFVENDDAQQLAQKLASVPLIENWCKAIRAKVEQQLFAGVPIPGWKIVQGKKGNKSWRDEAEAEAECKNLRLTYEQRYNMALKSPTALLKAIKEKPTWVARLSTHVTQRDGLPSVAPESDPRPVWVAPDAADDFSVVEAA